MSIFIEPLTLLHKDGTPYERSERVLAELRELLALPHSERAARAPGAHSESLAYFIRRRKHGRGILYGGFPGSHEAYRSPGAPRLPWA
jgi:hypothetical protein